MSKKASYKLISPARTIDPVKKERKNDLGAMQAWYFQTADNTYAFAVQKGVHGVKADIPADRVYYIVSGKAKFTIDGKDYMVDKGSVIKIPKHSTYNFCPVGKTPVEFFVDIGFKIDLNTIPTK